MNTYPRASYYADKLIKEMLAKDPSASSTEILRLFREFCPSYSLEKTAPGELGLAGWISVRRSDCTDVMLRRVAMFYFQLGVTNWEQFTSYTNWQMQDAEMVALHAGEEGLTWLKESLKDHQLVVVSELESLEAEYQAYEAEQEGGPQKDSEH